MMMAASPRAALSALALVAAIALSAPAVAQTASTARPAPSAASIESVNAGIVTDFYNIAFNQHKPTEAAQRYIGDVYIQHNPFVPNGAEPFTTYFEQYFKENPQSRSTIHRVITQGDLVVLHVHMQKSPEDRGQAIIDIFRVENGKIVEHWDVIQDVPAETANGNTMFSGAKAD